MYIAKIMIMFKVFNKHYPMDARDAHVKTSSL